jgi:enterobacterial common antigen flippase
MRRVWLQVVQTVGANGTFAVASGAVLFITARELGPSGRGAYAVLTGWVSFFATLGSLSLGQVVLHQAARRSKSDILSTSIGSCIAICAIVVALDWAVVLGGYVVTGGAMFRHLEPSHLALAFVALPFLIINANFPYVLFSLGELRLANLTQVTGAACGVVATLTFVWLVRLGVSGAVAGFVIGATAAGVLYIVHTLRRAPPIRFEWQATREMLARGVELHFNTVGTYLFTQTSVLILNHFRPLSESGYYQLATQLLMLTLLVSTSMGTVAYSLVSAHGPDGAWQLQRTLILRGMAVAAAAAAVAFVAAPWAVSMIAGPAFVTSTRLFRMMLPATVGGAFSLLMASQWIGRGLFWQAATVTFAVGTVSVVLDLILIPAKGMGGAVFSTLVTYGLSAVINVVFAVKIDRRVRSLSL